MRTLHAVLLSLAALAAAPPLGHAKGYPPLTWMCSVQPAWVNPRSGVLVLTPQTTADPVPQCKGAAKPTCYGDFLEGFSLPVSVHWACAVEDAKGVYHEVR